MKIQRKLTEHVVVDDGKHLEELCEGFGDKMVEKGEETIRIGFQNINGIKGNINASNEVFDVVAEKDIYIMGIAEININWTEKVKQAAKLAVKMRCTCWETQIRLTRIVARRKKETGGMN